MKGTLAIWFEPLDAARGQILDDDRAPFPRPRATLHFNLWRDLKSHTNFLDVGAQLDHVSAVSRIYLFVPVSVRLRQIQDLSTVLKLGQSLNAVFNHLMVISEENDHSYRATGRDSNDRLDVRIHSFVAGADLTVEPVVMDNGSHGTKITFTEGFCDRLRQHPAPAGYIRFRIQLNGQSGSLFTSEQVASNHLLALTLDQQELTEFRLNELRNVPTSLVAQVLENKFFLDAIHYFLIRDAQFQLLTQHAAPRKVRRLEPSLWRYYLSGGSSQAKAAYSEKVLKRLLIYHWRELATSDAPAKPARLWKAGTPARRGRSLEDFVAFASFRGARLAALWYVIGIVLLGAMGDSLASWLDGLWPDAIGPLVVGPVELKLPSKEQWTLAVVTVTFILLLALATLWSQRESLIRATTQPIRCIRRRVNRLISRLR